MCVPVDDSAMLCWLQTQLRVIEAWQAELSSRPDARHYDWLNEELSRLSTYRQAA